MIRRGLRAVVEATHDDWEICGEAADGRSAVEMVVRLQPDVVVMDVIMGNENGSTRQREGIEATREIRLRVPGAEVVIYTMSDEEHVIQAVAAAGAHGCVQKSEPGEHLLTAIEAVARHQPFFFTMHANQPFVAQRTARASATDQMAPIRDLTPRQLDVVRMLAQGMSNHEVGKALGITTNTAKTHRAAIMRRLDATSIVDVVLWALRHNLVDPVDPFAVD